MNELQHRVFQQLLLRLSPASIAAMAKNQWRIVVSEEAIERFADKVRHLDPAFAGDRSAPISELEPRSRAQARWSLLALRFPIRGADAFFNTLAVRLRPILTRGTLLLLLGVIGVGLGIVLAKGGEWRQQLSQPWPASSAAAVVILFLGTCVAHELAHGVTLKHFGGRVPEAGLLLLFFLPALYCDVTDSYGLPQKSRRLLVTAVGPLVQLALGAFCCVLSCLARPFPGISPGVLQATALLVGTTVGFNAIPLIRLDGYLLLAEWLDMPNLRTHSLCRLGSILHPGAFKGYGAPKLPLHEEAILWAYGIAATTFGGWVLFELGVKIASSRQARYVALLIGCAAVLNLTWAATLRYSRRRAAAVRTDGGREG